MATYGVRNVSLLHGWEQCLFLGVLDKIFGGKEWGDVRTTPFMAEQCLVFYRGCCKNIGRKSSPFWLFTFPSGWLRPCELQRGTRMSQAHMSPSWFSWAPSTLPGSLNHHLGMTRNGTSQVLTWSTWRALGILQCWCWSPRHRLGLFGLFES